MGCVNHLTVLRFTSVGAYLGDDEGTDILLPNKYLTNELEVGDEIDVFVYRDSEDRLVATTERPLIDLGGFAYLKIKEVNFYGAFADWGMEKDLMIPFKEQHLKLDEDKYYLCSLQIDTATDRLFGTTKVNRYFLKCVDETILNKPLSILICDDTDLGVKVVVDQRYQGVIYHSDITKKPKRGSTVEGYAFKLREDGKLDVRLGKPGYERIDDASQELMEMIRENGVLKLTDKSAPEDILRITGMSKKAFKQAVGKLYKERLITLEPTQIVWNN